MPAPSWLWNRLQGPDLVRQALDYSLTSEDLPDAIIQSDIYLGAAQDEVVSQDSLIATRTDPTQQVTLQRATILLTAAFLAPQLPVVTREADDTGYQIARQPVDLAALAGSLRARAEVAIAQVTDAGNLTVDKPTLFGAACGYRGF